jgi:hypothetical protein
MPILGPILSSAGRKPGTPIIGTATAGELQATVTFTAPSYLGKPNSSLTYTVVSSPGSISNTGSGSPIVVTGLSSGTSYTFTVKLNNTILDSDFSEASNSVSPASAAPFFPPFFPFFPSFVVDTPFFPFFPYFPFFPFFPFFPPFFPFFPPFFPFFPPFFPFFPFFPPFFPFFPPFFPTFPRFSQGPQCIYEDTLIKTSTGLVAVKNISVGDILYTINLAEVANDHQFSLEVDPEDFNSSTLTSTSGLVEAVVTAITAKDLPAYMYFNNNTNGKFSLEQPMFIKTSTGEYRVVASGVIGEGDYLINVDENGNISETLVESIQTVEEPSTMYAISCEPQDWFIADGYLVHNK